MSRWVCRDGAILTNLNAGSGAATSDTAKYATEASAFRRQRGIISEFGRCPGVIRNSDGTFSLTWEPEFWELKEEPIPVKLPDNEPYAYAEDMQRFEWLGED